MKLKDLFVKPHLFYARKGCYYPTFWGEAHTNPKLLKILGAKLTNVVYLYQAGMSYYLLDKDEHDRCRIKIFNKLLAEPRIIQTNIAVLEKCREKNAALLEKALPRLKTISLKKINDLIHAFNDALLTIQLYGDSAYYFTEKIANEKLTEKIAKWFNHDDEKIKATLGALTAFSRLSFIERERCELRKIALGGNASQLKEHVKKWQHYKFDYWGPATPRGEFERRYNQFKREKDKSFLAACDNYASRIKEEKDKIITRYKFPKDVVELANLVSNLGLLNDIKKGSITKLAFLVDQVLAELAQRKRVPKLWLNYLMPREIDGFIAGRFKVTAAAMKQRIAESIIVFKDGEYLECVTEPSNELLKDSVSFVAERMSAKLETDIFKGQGVYNATYQGEVVKMYSHLDIGKTKPGMVLVAPKTTVDFVAVLHQAGAVVTDYGGLTSHPAIMARELKIPGVVGTNIATQVLNDGDIVLVDGGKGEVKIIKKDLV